MLFRWRKLFIGALGGLVIFASLTLQAGDHTQAQIITQAENLIERVESLQASRTLRIDIRTLKKQIKHAKRFPPGHRLYDRSHELVERKAKPLQEWLERNGHNRGRVATVPTPQRETAIPRESRSIASEPKDEDPKKQQCDLDPLPEIQVSIGRKSQDTIQKYIDSKLKREWLGKLEDALPEYVEDYFKVISREDLIEQAYAKLPKKLKKDYVKEAIDKTIAKFILGDEENKEDFTIGFYFGLGEIEAEIAPDRTDETEISFSSDPDRPETTIFDFRAPDLRISVKGIVTKLVPYVRIGNEGFRRGMEIGSKKEGKNLKLPFTVATDFIPVSTKSRLSQHLDDPTDIRLERVEVGDEKTPPEIIVALPDLPTYHIPIDVFGIDISPSITPQKEQLEPFVIDLILKKWSNSDINGEKRVDKKSLRGMLNEKLTRVAQTHLHPILEKVLENLFFKEAFLPSSLSAGGVKMKGSAAKVPHGAIEEMEMEFEKYLNPENLQFHKYLTINSNYCLATLESRDGGEQLICSVAPSISIHGVQRTGNKNASHPSISLNSTEEMDHLVTDVPLELINRIVQELWFGAHPNPQMNKGLRRIYKSLATGTGCDLNDSAGKELMKWAEDYEKKARAENRKMDWEMRTYKKRYRRIPGTSLTLDIRQLCESGKITNHTKKKALQEILLSELEQESSIFHEFEFWKKDDETGETKLKGKIKLISPPRIIQAVNAPDGKSMDLTVHAEILNQTPGWVLVGSGITSELSVRFTPTEEGVRLTYLGDSAELNIYHDRLQDELLRLIAGPFIGGLDNKASNKIDDLHRDLLPTDERIEESKIAHEKDEDEKDEDEKDEDEKDEDEKDEDEKDEDEKKLKPFLIPNTPYEMKADEKGSTLTLRAKRFRINNGKIRTISELFFEEGRSQK